MDMERLVEDGEITSFSQENGEIRVSLQFENILEPGPNICLRLPLTAMENRFITIPELSAKRIIMWMKRWILS